VTNPCPFFPTLILAGRGRPVSLVEQDSRLCGLTDTSLASNSLTRMKTLSCDPETRANLLPNP
jgi:hypothetical protein